VRNIAIALIEARPDFAPRIKKRAHTYIEKIRKLDKKIRDDFTTIPKEERVIVTIHDAFSYFGRAYGVTFLTAQGINPHASPAGADIAALIKKIKKEKVKAIFIEDMESHRMMIQIAKDADVPLGGVLYADTLSYVDGPAATYLDMVAHNAVVMLKSLR